MSIFRSKVLVSAAAFLLGSASFLAGYLVAFEYQPTPIIIEKCADGIDTAAGVR